MSSAQSWGRLPADPAAVEQRWIDSHKALPSDAGSSMLAHGLGRSYGDVALNAGGTLLLTSSLDRFIAFDQKRGVLRAESGVSLSDVMALITPAGWALPVVPGTRFVTLGGAVANDVHGKNHNRAGSFGEHVLGLGLRRSDGQYIDCNPTLRADWLQATIGGLGLTGLICWVELQLLPGAIRTMTVQNRRFSSLDAFWDIDAQACVDHTHTVAWIDALCGGRGVYSAGSAASAEPQAERHPVGPKNSAAPHPPTTALPFTLPWSLVNPMSRRIFNWAYYHRPLLATAQVNANAFLFPLDGLADWNRIYGRRGFFQYQCLLPAPSMREALQALLRCLQRLGLGSALTVLKTFGDRPSRGLLSFARPGATLAMDFENRGEHTLRQLNELDAIVRDAGGALYPAKDARMSADMFRRSHPRLDDFRGFVDPGFSSGLWRRVNA